MLNKTFNIYCDESCHIEHDHKKHMILGSVSVALNQVKRHTERINELKKKHYFFGEIKWSNVSNSQLDFYRDLIDYFFDTDIWYRAVVVKKEQIYTEDFDTFYYKMYYYLLNHNKNTSYSYNVYLDIKDDLSAVKVNKLKEILNTKFGVFRNVQNIRSHESILLQLADFITGALSYNINIDNKVVLAKLHIIEKIKKHSGQPLDRISSYNEKKFNLFFIDLK